MVEAQGPVRSAMWFRSILSRQSLNRDMEQNLFCLAENPVFQFFAFWPHWTPVCRTIYACVRGGWASSQYTKTSSPAAASFEAGSVLDPAVVVLYPRARHVGGRNKPIGEMVKTPRHPPQIAEADKFKKPYIKVVWDSCLWDSGRWGGWKIILGLIPPFFRDIWSHETSNT